MTNWLWFVLAKKLIIEHVEKQLQSCLWDNMRQNYIQ
jgi:hypothetical protein